MGLHWLCVCIGIIYVCWIASFSAAYVPLIYDDWELRSCAAERHWGETRNISGASLPMLVHAWTKAVCSLTFRVLNSILLCGVPMIHRFMMIEVIATFYQFVTCAIIFVTFNNTLSRHIITLSTTCLFQKIMDSRFLFHCPTSLLLPFGSNSTLQYIAGPSHNAAPMNGHNILHLKKSQHLLGISVHHWNIHCGLAKQFVKGKIIYNIKAVQIRGSRFFNTTSK